MKETFFNILNCFYLKNPIKQEAFFSWIKCLGIAGVSTGNKFQLFFKKNVDIDSIKEKFYKYIKAYLKSTLGMDFSIESIEGNNPQISEGEVNSYINEYVYYATKV